MTLWAARARARQDPHRGVLAAALDSKFSLIFGFDLVQLGLTGFDELLLQSGWIRGLYSVGRGGRGVIMFVAVTVIGVMSLDLRVLSGFFFSFGLFCGVRARFLVTVVEDTSIVRVVRLPTSLRTTRRPPSPAFFIL
jgi:hypothetical protein